MEGNVRQLSNPQLTLLFRDVFLYLLCLIMHNQGQQIVAIRHVLLTSFVAEYGELSHSSFSLMLLYKKCRGNAPGSWNLCLRFGT